VTAMAGRNGYVVPFLAMSLAGFSLFFGVFVLKSLMAVFFSYYLLCSLGLPLLDLRLGAGLGLREIPRWLALSPVRAWDLALGALSGTGMAAIMIASFVALKSVFLADNRILASIEAWGVSRDDIAMVFVVMLAFNGALEELFWRGYIHRKFEDMGNRAAAVGIPALFFCSWHIFVISSLVANPLAIALFMAGIGGAGIVWGIMRERSGSVVPCVVSHMIVTAGYLGIFYVFILA